MATLNQAVKALNQKRATEAALRNEQITRLRVENLEAVVEEVLRIQQSGFWGRLRWLLLGR